MPSYNQADFLPQTLDSVLHQTLRDFEIVFVDDGSTDNTLNVIQKFSDTNPSCRIKILTHPDQSNHGISATSNLAIQNAQGEYIVILDSDDLWYPDTLAKRLSFMQTNPDVSLMCSHYDIIDENGKYLRRAAAPDITEDCRSPVTMTHAMAMGCVIGNPTVMIRRSCLANMELFDPAILHGDWELWTRLVSNHKAGFLPEPLVMHRRHEKNITGHHTMEVELSRRIDVMNALDRKALSTGGALALPRLRALIHLELCSYNFCLAQRKEAFDSLKKALETDPSLLSDKGVYLNTWLSERPHLPQPRNDFHAWFRALFA